MIDPIIPGATIGVLGSGQLGRMFALEARRLGYRVHTYSPDTDTPTGQVADREVVAAYEDLDAVKEFARHVSVVTFEFENVPAQTAEAVAQIVPVRPGGEVLHIAQNRLREKMFLSHQGIRCAPFRPVTNQAELDSALAELGTPALLKTAGFGYDGKGQVRLHSSGEAATAWEALGGDECVLEGLVAFDREVSLIGARGVSGEFAHYGLIENHHVSGILDLSVTPLLADTDRVNIETEAVTICREIFEALNVIGTLCVEFFLTSERELVVNEIAPRPHNSGHLTLDAHLTSQFEQQLRAVCGLPLGSTHRLRPAAMANLLGDLWEPGTPNWAAALALPNLKLHLYGKDEARPGRKMGHLTALAESPEEALSLVKAGRDALSQPF